jgi:hypothetical protein
MSVEVARGENRGRKPTSGSRGSIKRNADGVTCACGAIECDADDVPLRQRCGESLGQGKAGGEAKDVLHFESRN